MRRYLHGPRGQLHIAQTGPPDGPLVVLLHQVPRSVDEFRDVLPELGSRGLHAVAVDLPGYGNSDPAAADTIAAYADSVAAVFKVLGPPAGLVGHHTGGVVALELAARLGSSLPALVLSSTPYVDAEHRDRPAHGVDDVTRVADGQHLLDLWRGRQAFYPPESTELLERFVSDALRAGTTRSHAGHAAVRAYRMEDRVTLLSTRILIVAADADPYAAPQVPRLAAVLPDARIVHVPGGGVPLPDQLPAEFAALVADHVTGG